MQLTNKNNGNPMKLGAIENTILSRITEFLQNDFKDLDPKNKSEKSQKELKQFEERIKGIPGIDNLKEPVKNLISAILAEVQPVAKVESNVRISFKSGSVNK